MNSAKYKYLNCYALELISENGLDSKNLTTSIKKMVVHCDEYPSRFLYAPLISPNPDTAFKYFLT